MQTLNLIMKAGMVFMTLGFDGGFCVGELVKFSGASALTLWN